MKNVLMVLVIALLSIVGLMAQTKAPLKVPAKVATAFKAKFPEGQRATWDTLKSNYTVNFEVAQKRQAAMFDKNGKWLETETPILVNKMPGRVIMTVASNYSHYQIKATDLVEMTDSVTLYQVQLIKGDETLTLQLSKDGKIVNSRKE